MIVHRAIRDIQRCRKKYGKAWEQYEREVPYLFIPVSSFSLLLVHMGESNLDCVLVCILSFESALMGVTRLVITSTTITKLDVRDYGPYQAGTATDEVVHLPSARLEVFMQLIRL